jgi:hypothetical protein
MTTDYRAMCAELVDSVELLLEMRAVDAKPMAITEDRLTRARALLAQPVAEGPTDEELLRLAREWNSGFKSIELHFAADYARAVLAKWGHSTPQPEPAPVAVSEDLPEPGEWVWHCYAGVRLWQHGRYNGRQFFIGNGPESHPATHWLPTNALPTPEA